MKVMIINIDSKKIPNIALEKIKMYHRQKDDEIIEDFPLLANDVDKIYVSAIYSWNKNKAKEWENFNAEIGGSGYSLKKTLPPEIDKMKPKINLGFTTRGCIRKCKFCVVPKKEGQIKIVGDIYDFWDGVSKELVILDNNILAVPKHFINICKQIRKEHLRVDFNQGLDHRLLTQKIVDELKTISHIEYRFAFDHPSYIKTVDKAITLLLKNKINRSLWYVLVGFNTTFDEDLERLNYLKDRKQNAYVQRYNCTRERKYIPLARWANQHHIFNKMTYEQFLNHPIMKNQQF